LSQARQRWGTAADGFLTLFADKLILPGIADTRTLETISTALGEYDRRVISHTNASGGLVSSLVSGGTRVAPGPTTTTSTQRTRVLSPGEVANVPAGRVLHLDGVAWELLTLTPVHASEPWRTLSSTIAPAPTTASA
ncbi:MAG: TraM recognition domain-containing protein, partial [Trebonia sp.]